VPAFAFLVMKLLVALASNVRMELIKTYQGGLYANNALQVLPPPQVRLQFLLASAHLVMKAVVCLAHLVL